MQNLLLMGAGFSRNWGGWLANEMFEYLLGTPEVMDSADLRTLLWRHQREHSGFESALGSLRVTNNFSASSRSKAAVQLLERAIANAFQHMNARFWDQSFEWSSAPTKPMTKFLAKFDALFTLNQDLLLDYHYQPRDERSASGKTWADVELPSMTLYQDSFNADRDGGARYAYIEANEGGVNPQRNHQPLYKLHGSYGWSTASKDRMLIMGDNKGHDIEGSTVLRRYLEQFTSMLAEPDTRLMVIGYSFRDPHINQIIIDAVIELDLRIFVVDPAGYTLAQPVSVLPPALYTPSLADAFEKGLIGASRRPLREIFTSDSVEHAKLMLFFERNESLIPY